MQPQPSLNLCHRSAGHHEPADDLRAGVPAFGYGLFLSFADDLIVWHGMQMMFSHEGLGEQMFDFAKLLLFVSFGYALIAFYEAPIPGVGVSFSNLITDQAHYFQGPRRPSVRQYLSPPRRAGRPLHAAGRLVDSREPDVLDGLLLIASRRRCRSRSSPSA